jgi:hypothetical protein
MSDLFKSKFNVIYKKKIKLNQSNLRLYIIQLKLSDLNPDQIYSLSKDQTNSIRFILFQKIKLIRPI